MLKFRAPLHTALPDPSPADEAISCHLQHLIVDAITSQGGWIPFSQYMEKVLYEPEWGYYMRQSEQLGSHGDFTTAPELTPYFAKVFARQLAELLPHCQQTIYELGAGTGAFALHVLRALEDSGVMPVAYHIIEISPALTHKQRTLLQPYLNYPGLTIKWFQRLPTAINGVLIGNEFLDAMPCELVSWVGDTILQRGVGWDLEHLVWVDRPINEGDLASYARTLSPGSPYLSEIHLAQHAWLASAAKSLVKGAIILIDYGFPQKTYYHPQRTQGTLLGHYKQHVVSDPLFRPGLMDLSAHVDFTALAKIAAAEALTLVGYTTQAHFLVNGGLLDDLAQLQSHATAVDYFKTISSVQRLISSSEMGDLFKVMGLSRAIPTNWLGFADHDQSHLL